MSGNLLPSMTSLRCSSPVTVVTPCTTVCSCERGTLSRAQTVVQGETMVTGEEHLREVMKGYRYRDACCTGLAAVFADVCGYLLPSMTSLRCSSPVTVVSP